MRSQAGIACINDFVSAAHADDEVTGGEQGLGAFGLTGLRVIECFAFAGYVAGVIQRAGVQHRQVGQHFPQRKRPLHRTHSARIAADAFIAGQTHQGDARRTGFVRLAHHLVPPARVRQARRVDAAMPRCQLFQLP